MFTAAVLMPHGSWCYWAGNSFHLIIAPSVQRVNTGCYTVLFVCHSAQCYRVLRLSLVPAVADPWSSKIHKCSIIEY